MVERPAAFSHIRYLAAKKTVDDRALNRRIWERLRLELGEVGGPLRVLELGAGIGTMVERLVEWEMFAPMGGGDGLASPNGPAREVQLTLVDSDAACVAEVRRRLTAWAGPADFRVGDNAGRLRLERAGLTLVIEPVADNALAFVAAGPSAVPGTCSSPTPFWT